MAGTMAELLDRCRRGDEEAVRILVERFGPASRDLAGAIAQRLSVPQGAAKRRLHYARAWLRTLLLGYFAEPEETPELPDEPRLL